jgi:hypothetical protein
MSRATRRRNLHLQTLEALRLGVVPRVSPEQLTVAREQELALVEQDLVETPKVGSARVFLGDYGTGKTHLLELIEHLALSRNFLCSRIVLDEEEVPPSHPQRGYRALCRGLRYPEGGQGLAPLLDRIVPHERWLRAGSASYHHYLSPVLQYWKALEPEDPLRDELQDWIEGHPSASSKELEPELRRRTRLRGLRLFALKDYRPWAHLYSYLIGGLAHLAQQAGYEGLVLLFDEAEFYGLLNSTSREFADLVFGYYATAALGEERSHFDLSRAKRGGQSIHRSFPPLYQRRQPLYCVFAMTEDPAGVGALRRIVGEDRLQRLTPLGLGDYQQLCLKVVELYRAAYEDCKVGQEVQNPMGQVVYRGVERGVLGNPRQVLKFVMELLDFSRLRRDEIGDFVAEVMEILRNS